MPSKDWYQNETGLNRTMCPKCGEDTHFIITARWNLRDEDDAGPEHSARKFRRHLYPSNHEFSSRNIKPTLQDDSPITCGSCGTTFSYVEGRDAYAKFEEDTVNSFLIPTTTQNPWVMGTSEYNYGSLCYPVVSYDAFGGRGIGNRQTHLFTSSILLSVYANAADTPRWKVQIPDREGHRGSADTWNENTYLTKLEDISIPPEINPYLITYFSRLLYSNMLELDHEDESSEPFEIIENTENKTEISTDEANEILNTLFKLKEYGDKCEEMFTDLTPNLKDRQFMLAETTDGQFAMCCHNPLRIHKKVATSMQIPLIESKDFNPDYSSSECWRRMRETDSRIRKRTGNISLYYYKV